MFIKALRGRSNKMKWLYAWSVVVLLAGGCASTPNGSGEPGGLESSPSGAAVSPTDNSTTDSETMATEPGDDTDAVAPEEYGDEDLDPDDDTDGTVASSSSAGAEKLARCGLTQQNISYMQRDWQRVVDSVDRMDHAEYTDEFVTYLGSLQEAGEGCHASQALDGFIEAAESLNQSAEEPADDYEVYGQIAESGNAWLDQLGITPNQLAAG